MSTLTNCPFCNARVEVGAARCPVCRNGLPSVAPSPRQPAPTTSLQASSPHAFNERIDGEDELATAHEIRTPPPAPAPGVLVGGRYRLSEVLGTGVLGTSWAARDSIQGLEVVAKFVSEDLLLDDDARFAFVQGIEMFTSRTVAGCVLPQEVAVHGSLAFVITPRVHAVSLRSVIEARRARREGFTPEEALRVLLSLVGATQALHSATPHGSIRPENVLLSRKGLFLTDCVTGVCVPPDRVVHAAGDWPVVMPYLAPEVLRGRRPTASADLFAFGAIAVELLGGAPPGRGGDVASVSVELHKATAVLLDQNPQKRPAGVRMLLDTLSQVAGFATRPNDPPLPVPESTGLHPEPVAPMPMPQSFSGPPVVVLASASVQPSAASEATGAWREKTDARNVRQRMPSDPSIPVDGPDLDGATVARKAPESRGDAVTVARPAPVPPVAAPPSSPTPPAASSPSAAQGPPPGRRVERDDAEERTTVGPAPTRRPKDPAEPRSTPPAAAAPSKSAAPPKPAAPEDLPATEPHVGAPPGRLSSATASLPRYGATGAPSAPASSGPPPSMSVKSGPPPGAAYASGPPPAIAPAASSRSADAEGPPPPIAPVRAIPSIVSASKPPAASAPSSRPVPPTTRMQPMVRPGQPAVASPPPSVAPMPPGGASVPPPRRPVPSAPPAPVRAPPPSAAPRPGPSAVPPGLRVPAPPMPGGRSVPSAPSVAPRPSASVKPPASKPPRSRSPTQADGIDPRLLRAAQMLDAERTGQVLTSDDLEDDD